MKKAVYVGLLNPTPTAHAGQEDTTMHEPTTNTLTFPSSRHRDVLTEILHDGAQRLLTQAIDIEVEDYLNARQHLMDGRGHRQVVRNGFLPVVTCLASDEEGNDYNINGDMFAGHLAGALRAERYLILTDVDGLMKDIEDPESLITDITLAELEPLFGTVIQGGMIPKLESCRIALKTGARSAAIINGTKPKQIEKAATAKKIFGTQIQPA